MRMETPVAPDDTAGTLTARLATLGAELLVRTLDAVFNGSAREVVQDAAAATMTKKIRKHHGLIDWSRDAAFLARHVRAMTPWPSAYTFHRGRRVIIDAALARESGPAVAPGTVLSDEPLIVACGAGALEIRTLRPEGRRAMTPAEYRAGNPLSKGDVFAAAPE
jgi:methionyl-tRNA formyltransferase